MAKTLREKLAAHGRKMLSARQQVDLPGFDQPLFVRLMNGQERSDFERALILASPDGKPGDNPAGFRAALLRSTVYDQAGEAVWQDAEDAELLGLPASLLEPLVDAAMRLNGLSKADREVLEKK